MRAFNGRDAFLDEGLRAWIDFGLDLILDALSTSLTDHDSVLMT